MADTIISFREFLRGHLESMSALLGEDEETVDLLSEIVLLLSNYQEEGVDLFPVVFLTQNELAFQEHLDARELVRVGQGPVHIETIRRAFKSCAPLAEDRLWSIYIVYAGRELRYGIFRADPSPLAPTVFENLRNLQSAEAGILGLTRFGGHFVEIRGSNGESRFVNVAGPLEDDYHPARVIRRFVEGVTRDAEPELKQMLRSFYYRFIMDVVHSAHGSLIGIVPRGLPIADILEDGIHLKPAIEVRGAIENIHHTPSAQGAYLRLVSYSLLLRKLTGMDGITLIDSSGDILAYNCFIRSSHERPQSLVTGGARRRAFEQMVRHMPAALSGAFYKSRDGHLDFRG